MYSDQNGTNRVELDFVIETGEGIFVLEVKSGKDRTAPSISKVDRIYKVARRFILSDDNICIDDLGTIHLPLFVSFFFRELESKWDGPAL